MKAMTDTVSAPIPIRSIQGWHEFLSHGEGFLRTAARAYEGKKKAFTPEILYNLVAMSIEKFTMAALMRHGTLPYNHTMRDLVEAMDLQFPGVMNDCRDELLELDSYQEICDPEGFSIAPPDMEQVPGMIELAGKMKELVYKKIA